MLRFPNPGADIDLFIRIFKTLHAVLLAHQPFGLDDISKTLTSSNLAASSGYVGEEALRLSTRADRSRDPLYNQSKMYAELFRTLGWICNVKGRALSFVFTFLGDHVAAANINSKIVFEESIIGASFPNRILDVSSKEISRPYQAALFTACALDGYITRDELIIGTFSTNDNNARAFGDMLNEIRSIRGSRAILKQAIDRVAKDAGIQINTLRNYTRFPMSAMQYCGWFTKSYEPVLYPGGRNVILCLTEYGRQRSEQLRGAVDWRLADYDRLSVGKQSACVKLGFYSMLKRAQFDTSALIGDMDLWHQDLGIGADVPLVFSPYQTIHYTEADAALGIVRCEIQEEVSSESLQIALDERDANIQRGTIVRLNQSTHGKMKSADDSDLSRRIRALLEAGTSQDAIADQIFSELRFATKETYYPLVAELFSVCGVSCHALRAGINYERWDAIIVDDSYSIPIEIKSPTEEEFLSIKAVRQALENKIVLLSRRAYCTDAYSTTMAVGYRPPNDRAEVTRLIQDIKAAYGIRIAVIDLLSLLRMSISVIAGTAEIGLDLLKEMEGIVDVDNS